MNFNDLFADDILKSKTFWLAAATTVGLGVGIALGTFSPQEAYRLTAEVWGLAFLRDAIVRKTQGG